MNKHPKVTCVTESPVRGDTALSPTCPEEARISGPPDVFRESATAPAEEAEGRPPRALRPHPGLTGLGPFHHLGSDADPCAAVGAAPPEQKPVRTLACHYFRCAEQCGEQSEGSVAA